MRKVGFLLWDRVVLIPVELVGALPLVALIALVAWVAFSSWAAISILLASLAGLVRFPILLYVLPDKDFTSKGFFVGTICALLFAISTLTNNWGLDTFSTFVYAFCFLTVMPPISAFFALNFTGSTPFTSPTAVRQEIYSHSRSMALLFSLGIVSSKAYHVFTNLTG